MVNSSVIVFSWGCSAPTTAPRYRWPRATRPAAAKARGTRKHLRIRFRAPSAPQRCRLSAHGRAGSRHFVGLFNMEPAPRAVTLRGMARPTHVFRKNSLRKRHRIKASSEQPATDDQRTRDKAVYGSLGAASPVRRIDPSTGEVVAVLDPETGAMLPMARAKVRRR
jgi:hypothetical protein